MLEEQQSFADFSQAAREFYDSLTDIVSVLELWERLAYIADSSEIDGELIREYVTDDGPAKVIMGPPFIIVFDNTLSGRLWVLYIQRASFLRPS